MKGKIKFNKKYLWIILGILFVIIIIFLIRNHMGKLEKDLLIENSDDIMMYMENIDNGKSEDMDKYILYALNYSYGNNDSNELECSEIKRIIEDKFDVKLDSEELNRIGITPLLIENNVMHYPDVMKYSIDKSNILPREIINKPIIFYKRNHIKKRGHKYIIEYQKITIESSQKIFDYYSEKNMKIEEDSNNKKKNNKEKEYDTSKIVSYMTGKGNIKGIKEAINDEIIKKYGKVDKKVVKVYYRLKGTKFVVEKIK